MTTTIYTVSGMTCGGCVRRIRAAVGALDGVSEVDVRVRVGQVTVTGDAAVDPEQVRSAISAAGYEVVQ